MGAMGFTKVAVVAGIPGSHIFSTGTDWGNQTPGLVHHGPKIPQPGFPP